MTLPGMQLAFSPGDVNGVHSAGPQCILNAAEHVCYKPNAAAKTSLFHLDLGALALNLNLNHYFYHLTVEK